MKKLASGWPLVLTVVALSSGLLIAHRSAHADPSKYPQFAQQSLPENVTPSFISVDVLVNEIKAGKKPLIIDVRTPEEFHDAHIFGALSAPLSDFQAHVRSIPRDRLVVLY